jgi:hypothetical protein
MENGTKKIGLRVAAGFLVAVTIIVAVFASGITLPSQKVSTGRLTVLLMDSPVELEKLLITITDLEVHQVGQEEAEGEGWITLIEDEEITFDLLEYRDGKTLNLASVVIAAATYNKIRMYVSEANAFYPEAPENPVPLRVPPGKIDVITEFELEEGGTRIVTIDMEPDWVAISKSNNLRPVLKASISEEPTITGED